MKQLGQLDSTRRRASTTLGRAITVSVIAHVGVVIVALITIKSAHSRKPAQNVIVTELVRLGKERPKDLLPRKDEPPPPPEKAEPPPQTKPTDPPPQTKPTPPKDATPSAKDRLSQLSKVQNALDRLKNQDEPEGREDGSQYGTTNKALAGNKLASEVYACMKAHWDLLGMSPAQAAGRSAKIAISVQKDGRLSDLEITKSSGDQRFDSAVKNAAQKCGRVSPPDAEIAEQARKDGFEVTFTP
ncbi:MAG: TonB family protein [Myxococcota bacterium]|nr:TonB family protein [Myxococcota bacterium]